VDPNINVSVRKQIRFAKLKKELAKAAVAADRPRVATPKRFGKKPSKDALVEDVERRRARRAGESGELWLNGEGIPVVFVDGYNVVNNWDATEGLMQRGELSKAREVLRMFAGTYGVRRGHIVKLVWDAHGLDEEPRITRWSRHLEEIFAAGEADEYIIRQTGQLATDNPERDCIVVSDDKEVLYRTVGAAGLEHLSWLNTHTFVREMEVARGQDILMRERRIDRKLRQLEKTKPLLFSERKSSVQRREKERKAALMRKIDQRLQSPSPPPRRSIEEQIAALDDLMRQTGEADGDGA